MRVLISGGGTGGHVYPALAVAARLGAASAPQSAEAALQAGASPAAPQNDARCANQDETPSALLWIGTDGGMEEALVRRAGLAYATIRTGKIAGISPLRMVANLGRMALGVGDALRLIRSFGAEVCLVTGGYVCAPVVVACRLRRIPVVIYLPDIRPGAAIRHLSRIAQRVAVTAPEAAHWFGGEFPQGKAVVTGYPVRDELIGAVAEPAQSRRTLAESLQRPQLVEDAAPIVLIWGGSQGSRSINQATWEAAALLTQVAHVVHVVGERDWPLYAQQRQGDSKLEGDPRYHAVAYLHEAMSLALAAASLTVARAGASSLGEFSVAGLPSILVPLPFAGVNQRENAAVMAAKGAAIVVEDDALAAMLAPTVQSLLEDGPRLRQMSAAAKQMARPDAAQKIADELGGIRRTS